MKLLKADKSKEQIKELKKLERQARQLVYKMDRIQIQWNKLKDQINKDKRRIHYELGDVLSRGKV